MKRDPTLFARAAAAAIADLSRTLGDPRWSRTEPGALLESVPTSGGRWAADVSDELTLTITDGVLVEEVALGTDVAEEEWPAEAWAPRYLESTLVAEAEEAIMTEVMEVLRLWGVEWPHCPDHADAIDPCSGDWVCTSGAHVWPLGRLGNLDAEDDA